MSASKYEAKKARLQDRLRQLDRDLERIGNKAKQTMAEITECDRLMADTAKAKAPA